MSYPHSFSHVKLKAHLSSTEEHHSVLPTDIDIAYFERIKAMTPAERLAHCAAMLEWTRQQIGLQLKQADPSISPQELKWKVALRLYENEHEIVKLIESQLAHVSG